MAHSHDHEHLAGNLHHRIVQGLAGLTERDELRWAEISGSWRLGHALRALRPDQRYRAHMGPLTIVCEVRSGQVRSMVIYGAGTATARAPQAPSQAPSAARARGYQQGISQTPEHLDDPGYELHPRGATFTEIVGPIHRQFMRPAEQRRPRRRFGRRQTVLRDQSRHAVLINIAKIVMCEAGMADELEHVTRDQQLAGLGGS